MKFGDWVGLLGLCIALGILWQFRQIVLLIFTAAVLAIALNRLVRWLGRRFSLPRSRAILIALAIVLIGVTFFISVVVPPFIGQFHDLLKLVPEGYERVITWTQDFSTNPPDWFPSSLLTFLPDMADVSQQVGGMAQSIFDNFVAFFSNAVNLVLQIILILVLTLMFLVEPRAYRQLTLRLFPSHYRRRADQILTKCETSLLSWIVGFSLSSTFVALASSLGLLILGIPLVLAHGLLAGVANLIPNIGPTLSVIFPVLVALLNAPGKAIIVIALYILVQNLESYWFSPMVMKHQVSLLPAATLIAQIFFASFLGPLGLLLAIPLAVICKVWLEEALIIDVLEGGKPQLEIISTESNPPTES